MTIDTEGNQGMRCPQCGGAMEVQYIGEMRDKRAVCQYCSTEVDLPDSYRRVKKKRTHEQNLIGRRTVEETVIETHRDGQLSTEDTETLPPEIQELLGILKEKGPEALDDELLRKLQARGINVSFDSESFDSDPLQSLKVDGHYINDASPMEYPPKEVNIRTGK